MLFLASPSVFPISFIPIMEEEFMASLENTANEVKALLEDVKTIDNAIKGNTNTIKSDTTTVKNNTTTIINQINQVDNDLKTGFTNLAQGLQILINLGVQSNQLQADNNKQNETIICWLTNIADTLCDVKHNTDKEVVLQTDISKTLHHLDDVSELVNSREALEVANLYELDRKIEKCCPPEEVPVRPCFEKCASPKTTGFDPINPDWKPVKFPRQDGPN